MVPDRDEISLGRLEPCDPPGEDAVTGTEGVSDVPQAAPSGLLPVARSVLFVPVFATCPPFCSMTALVSQPREKPAALPREAHKVATGVTRLLYLIAGLFNVGMAYLGAILPGLPTTPWVLMASYCFSKSSPRLERWLKRSPMFGKLLRDWDEHGGMRRPVKVLAVCMVVTVVSLSITFGGVPVWVKCVIGGLASIGVCTIVFAVPTVTEERPRT